VVSDELVMTGTERTHQPNGSATVVDQLWVLRELGERLAGCGSSEAAVELAAEAIGLCLGASWQRPRAEGNAEDQRDCRRAIERARAAGRAVSSGAWGEDGEAFYLVALPALPSAPFEALCFRRKAPFSELEQSLAALGLATLQAALRHRVSLDELRDSRVQLEQSQRLETIGQLASGVAHDFNNLLMVISAAAEVVSDSLSPDDPSTPQLGLILDTSHRAAELTRKLLVFSRKGRPVTRSVDVHDVLGTVREFLAHGIDRRITLQLSLCDGPCMVAADPTQLGNAILNICLNARDAMPDGGLLRISSQRVELGAEVCQSRYVGCEPGAFVRLEIKDTGTGMDAQTLARAFEPFFTTKAPGRGTGLGLPVVLASMREHKGSVVLDSQPGGGTTCSLLLPLVSEAASVVGGSAPESTRTAALRVLLVDDEPDVCLTAAQLMRQLGHNVQALCSGEKALSHLRVHATGYDLLVLDLMMPHPTGPEVYRALAKEGIQLPTLFVSGSMDQPLLGALARQPGVAFLQKPFRQAELALAIAHCSEAWHAARVQAAPDALCAG
jgi:signal transduction histidine kinase/ActR/RegA family two-component response regulator